MATTYPSQAKRRGCGLVNPFPTNSVPPSSNLWGWWDASLAYTDAGKTTLCSSSGVDVCYTLADRSGNGRDMVQSAAGNRPTWYSSQLNGYPALRFDGADDILSKTGMSNNTALSFYAVFKQISWTNNDYLTYVEGASHYGGIYQDTTSPQLQIFTATPSGNSITNNNLSVGSYGLVSISINGASSSFALNNNASTGTLGSSVDLTSIYLGGTSGANRGNFDICEYLIYSTGHAYNSGDGLAVRQYLNSKYALGLSI